MLLVEFLNHCRHCKLAKGVEPVKLKLVCLSLLSVFGLASCKARHEEGSQTRSAAAILPGEGTPMNVPAEMSLAWARVSANLRVNGDKLQSDLQNFFGKYYPGPANSNSPNQEGEKRIRDLKSWVEETQGFLNQLEEKLRWISEYQPSFPNRVVTPVYKQQTVKLESGELVDVGLDALLERIKSARAGLINEKSIIVFGSEPIGYLLKNAKANDYPHLGERLNSYLAGSFGSLCEALDILATVSTVDQFYGLLGGEYTSLNQNNAKSILVAPVLDANLALKTLRVLQTGTSANYISTDFPCSKQNDGSNTYDCGHIKTRSAFTLSYVDPEGVEHIMKRRSIPRFGYFVDEKMANAEYEVMNIAASRDSGVLSQIDTLKNFSMTLAYGGTKLVGLSTDHHVDAGTPPMKKSWTCQGNICNTQGREIVFIDSNYLLYTMTETRMAISMRRVRNID